jgi:hypothetical protein
MKQFPAHRVTIGIVLMLAALTLLVVAAMAVQPATDLASVAVAADLPPRPPTPTPDALAPAPIEPNPVAPAADAFVILHIPAGHSQLWTVVQWAGVENAWHDVDGWRGHLDDGDGKMKIWWVGPEHYGSGPMRWQVYDGSDGRLRATSDSFMLPARGGERVTIEVELAP